MEPPNPDFSYLLHPNTGVGGVLSNSFINIIGYGRLVTLHLRACYPPDSSSITRQEGYGDGKLPSSLAFCLADREGE